MGEDSDQGLANGFLALMGRVGNASRKVANNSLMVASSSLDKITSILNSDLNSTARITPIVGGIDYGSINPYTIKTLQSGLSTNPIDLNFAEKKIQNGRNILTQSKDYGPEVLDSFRSLEERISDLGTKLDSMQVVLDSGALVGGINTKIDQSLGKTTSRKWRHI